MSRPTELFAHIEGICVYDGRMKEWHHELCDRRGGWSNIFVPVCPGQEGKEMPQKVLCLCVCLCAACPQPTQYLHIHIPSYYSSILPYLLTRLVSSPLSRTILSLSRFIVPGTDIDPSFKYNPLCLLFSYLIHDILPTVSLCSKFLL